MNSTSLWPKTVATFLLTSLILLEVQAFYDGSSRRLEITPKDCTSLKYPNTIGTCMFNLKCKEKLGVVIGACVDRFLFGACCHFPHPQNVTTSPAEGVLPTTTQLDKRPVDGSSVAQSSPAVTHVPTSAPEPDSENDLPSTHYPQTVDPLPPSDSSVPPRGLEQSHPSVHSTTLLPVHLETVPSSSDPPPLLYNGNHGHLHSTIIQLPLSLEHSTLRTNFEETTEDPPKFSTFMYVDRGGWNFDKSEPTTYPTTLPAGNDERIGTTMEPPSLDHAGTDTLWSIVHQLAPNSPEKGTPEVEVELNSDELYTVLSAAHPMGSLMENRIQIIPPLREHPFNGLWKVTTSSSMSEVSTSFSKATTPPPTSRPWASSTYQIHTFKYPGLSLTTPLPGSGEGSLVTWSGVFEDANSNHVPGKPATDLRPSTTLPMTTEKMVPSSIRTTTTPRPKTTATLPVTTSKFPLVASTKPVAEVTRPPPPTTVATTTPPTTTAPPKKKVTPKPTVKRTTAKPKPTVPPKKQTIQPGILQSDFDSNIDDFVNQVVQNLAGSLDNLDLDEVILHPPSLSSPMATPKDETPPTLHPLHVLSDPLFPPFPVVGQVPLIKPGRPPVKKISSTTTTTTTTARPLDYRRDCGVRPLNKRGRIVGGTPSRFGKWPWQALVREATWLGLFSKNKCGGVLISPKYVLTAAHCQPGFLATLTVVLGDFDLSSETEGTTGGNKNANSVTKNVRRVIVHRGYNAQTFENDIALLELETPVEYRSHIVPICLPRDDEVHVGQQAIVTGWGRLKYGGGIPNTLHEVEVPILNNTDCQNMFLKSGHIKAIRDSFLCAGYANGAKDSCEGDSGGPLAMLRPNGQWMLAGTVSHGIKCAYPNLPGVYMRMTHYKPWIKRVTGIKIRD